MLKIEKTERKEKKQEEKKRREIFDSTMFLKPSINYSILPHES